MSKPNLEQRMRDTLDADFPDWVWELKPGQKIAVAQYCGSWSPPGTRYWYEEIFICIAGKFLYYMDVKNNHVSYTTWGLNVKHIDELAAIDAEIDAYRAAHPNWQNEGM